MQRPLATIIGTNWTICAVCILNKCMQLLLLQRPQATITDTNWINLCRTNLALPITTTIDTSSDNNTVLQVLNQMDESVPYQTSATGYYQRPLATITDTICANLCRNKLAQLVTILGTSSVNNGDVFGPLPATMGDTPNRPKMTTKNQPS